MRRGRLVDEGGKKGGRKIEGWLLCFFMHCVWGFRISIFNLVEKR